MKAILVVANKTLGGRNLADYLEGRCRNGPLVIHLLVPLEHLPVWCAGDPFMADTTWLDPAWEAAWGVAR